MREKVVFREEGLRREGTCCARLIREEELADLLRRAGFDRLGFLNDFSSHENPGDYGLMTQRVRGCEGRQGFEGSFLLSVGAVS